MSDSINIVVKEFPECVRTRPGMYVGGVDDPSVIFREIIDNAFDESYAYPGCNQIFIDQDYNGYHIVADNGRGLPITMSPDKPEQTMADVAVSYLHSGSKFSSTEVSTSRVGQNGVGSAACNALSESFIVLSVITESNYASSIPPVQDLWLNSGPRSKKDLFYIVAYEDGIKVYEGAHKLKDIEKLIFGKTCPRGYVSLPTGYSTIILFKPDSKLFTTTKSKLPLKNIQYFLLIQEKFYKRKVNVVVNGESMSGSFVPYQFEIIKTMVPSDPSKNPSISMYVTFEVDPELGPRVTEGSANGLVTDTGQHIQFAEICFEDAIRNEFKIKHRCIFNGLKMCVVLLAQEVVFDSQTKTRLKSISKVKATDFSPITKEMQKIFRSFPEYWGQHVDRLCFLADSMRSLSAAEKAEKLISGTGTSASYKLKSELQGKFVDATAGQHERFACELFVVEGDSAGGSLVGGRKGSKYHAVLPLRGRVVNTEGMNEDKMLENKEMYTLFRAAGLGLDVSNVMSTATTPEEAMEILRRNARYGKIIISTDADADGSIIASSLLYTISRFARFMIDLGLVYLIESPIFSQDGHYFFPSDPTIDGEIPVGLNMKKHFRRYKGLGSLNPDEIYDAFYDESKRRLIQVTPDGIDYARSLVEDIRNRKNLLISKGILGDPFGLGL